MTTQTSTSLRFAVALASTNGFVDAHTFLVRGGVFANVQTGNVVLLAVDAAGGRLAEAAAHVAPIVSFVVGIAVAMHVKTGRLDRVLARPLRTTMAVQALVFAVIAVVPTDVPALAVTVPVSLLAGVQVGLFRVVGDLAYLPVATTGNLMRLVESSYSALADRDDHAATAARTYGALLIGFAGGALVGALVSRAIGGPAMAVPAAVIAATLLLFVLDERARETT